MTDPTNHLIRDVLTAMGATPPVKPMTYKLYSSAVRSRLEIRAPYLEASSSSVEELRGKEVFRYQPALITDEAGNVIEDNGLL